MTDIDTIIQPGESIPDDVTGVQGGAKSRWRLTSKGHWHLPTAQVTCLNDDCGVDGYALMRANGQVLTVTAVREQPAEPERCDACGSEDPPEGCHIGCPKLAEPEPDVLALVRQYGAACAGDGEFGLDESASEQDERMLDARQKMLFARIVDEVQRLRDELATEVRAHRATQLTQPDLSAPQVLSLPQVTEGAVALIGGNTGKRYLPDVSGTWRVGIIGRSLGGLLDIEGSVTVVMAPTLAEDLETVRSAIGEEYVGDEVHPALARIETALKAVTS